MTVVALAGITGLGLLAGVLIGAVGIGGVILVPALAYLAGYSVHTAIPAAMAAYIVAGAIGTFAYWRAGSVPWTMAGPLFLGAMPAAIAGAIASTAAPSAVLEMSIGILTAVSGLNTWRDSSREADRPSVSLTRQQLTLAGAFTGFSSSLTGTGGPLVLVPILMWLKCPVLASVGLAQVVQLPIALLATIANMWSGTVDARLAACLALGMALGTWVGAKIAHAVPRQTLRLMIAVILGVVGVVILLKTAGRLMT